jgi:plasmid maintenance system antidote protein VapI
MARKRPKTLSDQLRDAIEQSGMSRYRLAEESGVDAASLCRFVAGQTGLTLKNIDRIGQVIGLRLVIGGKPERKKGK